jgi:hypothetical protein
MVGLIPVPRYRRWEIRWKCPHCSWPVQIFWMDDFPPFTGVSVPLHVARICTSCNTLWEPSGWTVTAS